MLKRYNDLNDEEKRFVNDALLEYVKTYTYEKESKQNDETYQSKVYTFDDYVKSAKELLPLIPEQINEEQKNIKKSINKIERLQKMDDNMILTIIGTILSAVGTCAILQEDTTICNLAISTIVGGFASLKLSDKFIEKRTDKHYVDAQNSKDKIELLQKAQTHFWGFDDYYKKLEKTIK